MRRRCSEAARHTYGGIEEIKKKGRNIFLNKKGNE
jgi:hypothetical protein